MKLESIEIREALSCRDFESALSMLARHFRIARDSMPSASIVEDYSYHVKKSSFPYYEILVGLDDYWYGWSSDVYYGFHAAPAQIDNLSPFISVWICNDPCE